MSFDVFLFRFTPVPEGFDNGAALLKILDAITALQCESIAARIGEHEGKAEVEVNLPLGHGYVGAKDAAFFLRTLAPPIVELLHTVAVAGDMVVIPTEEARFILVREEQRQHLPEDTNFEQVVCVTPDDLGALLLGGFDEWAAYRDHVLRDAEGMPGTDDGAGN